MEDFLLEWEKLLQKEANSVKPGADNVSEIWTGWMNRSKSEIYIGEVGFLCTFSFHH